MTTSTTVQPHGGRADVATSVCVKAIKFTLFTTIAVCSAMALIALVSAGSEALNAVLMAGTILVVVFGPGLAAVTMVSRVSPPATLLVGLMTYVLQMVVLVVMLQRLAASDWLHGRVDPSWLGATLIAAGWETPYRAWVAAGVLVLLALAALACLAAARAPIPDSTHVQALRDEWQKDRAWLASRERGAVTAERTTAVAAPPGGGTRHAMAAQESRATSMHGT